MFCNSTLMFITSGPWKYTTGLGMLSIAVLGTMENAIVIIVLFKYERLQTSTNKIIGSLALADLLSSLVVAPLHAVQILHANMLRNCKIDMVRTYSAPILIGVSTYIMAFISYDRYLHLRQLQDYHMSNKKLYSVMFGCWSAAIVIPMVRLADSIEARTIYSILVIVNGVLILLTLLTSYVVLLAMLRIRQTSSRFTNIHQIKNERQAAKTIILIISLYVMMLIPLLIYHGLYTIDDNLELRAKTYIVGMVLAIGNSTINPVIYCYKTPPLRKHVKKLLGIRPDRKISRTRSLHLHGSGVI